MDVREKMVELIRCADYHPCGGAVRKIGSMFTTEFIEDIASQLIANGVTVQEWISVDERLPENFISVFGYMTDAGEFPQVRECYTVGNAFFFPALGDVHPVSHWCEIPDPPKGE